MAAGLAAEWTSGPGVQVQKMPTLYGGLELLRAHPSTSIRFDLTSDPVSAASIELRPPLSGRLLGVTVNGSAHEDFDAQSVIISEHAGTDRVCHTTATA